MTDNPLNDNRLYKFPEIIDSIWKERIAQEDKWGDFSNMPDYYIGIHEKIAVLAEEFGEAVKEAMDGDPFGDDLYKELIQTAAVCAAWAEAILRFKDGEPRHPLKDLLV